VSDPRETARALFEGVMAPLVLGGAVHPGHAIGARSALALTSAVGTEAVDAALLDRVQARRVRAARRVAPVDSLGLATDAEWRLAAALHDVLQSASPAFDAPLRRGAAARILDVAIALLDRVAPPAHAGEALSRHTWLGRVLDVQRTDTQVSWWTGSRTFRGTPPPARLTAWPELRRVSVVTERRAVLDVEPLAVDRARLTEAVAWLLERSPLTSMAACARAAPVFAWSGATLALVATRAGRTMAARAIDRLPQGEARSALGRATRELLERRPGAAGPALELLAERATGEAQAAEEPQAARDGHLGGDADAQLALALGALVALRRLSDPTGWTEDARRRIAASLAPIASSDAGERAAALLRAAGEGEDKGESATKEPPARGGPPANAPTREHP
jgi:hypothetical protein